jgi:hypothetical protein
MQSPIESKSKHTLASGRARDGPNYSAGEMPDLKTNMENAQAAKQHHSMNDHIQYLVLYNFHSRKQEGDILTIMTVSSKTFLWGRGGNAPQYRMQG